MKINGNIEAINEVLVNTRNGKSPKTNIIIDGKTYSMWGSNKGLTVGQEVSFEFESKGVFNNIVNDNVVKVQANKLPIQQVSKTVIAPSFGTIPSEKITVEPVEKDLLKQIVAKIAQLESQVNVLTTLCSQYNERISLLADTNKTLNDRVRRLEDINRDIEANKIGG